MMYKRDEQMHLNHNFESNWYRKCEMPQTIGFTNSRVLMNRVRGMALHKISAVQYGFMSDRDTRNAIYVLRRLVYRYIEKLLDGYVCIEYNKALDTAKHKPLIHLTIS